MRLSRAFGLAVRAQMCRAAAASARRAFVGLTLSAKSAKSAMSSLAVLLLTVAPAAGHAAPKPALPVQGVVTQVIDGASLRFTPLGQPAITVQVRDIEAPVGCQPGAAQAKAALSALALNKSASLSASGLDAQGRMAGRLRVDDVDIGLRMVEDGQAWSVRTRNDRGPLVKQERMAKALGRGLHATAGALPPRDWRRTRGACPAAAP